MGRVSRTVTCIAALCVVMMAAPAHAAEPAITIASGAGSFTFVDAKGDPQRPMTVYTYLPKGLPANEARIVFVMHGHGKNAPGYRDRWGVQADKHKFMVIAPLFDAKRWHDGDYAYPMVMRKSGKPTDPEKWSFSVVEHLFDAVKGATGNHSERYLIYGHSEGGQFVHRLVLLLPDARYARAVAANPGWYTMPRFDVAYPYGLGASPATDATLTRSLQRDVVLMLGQRDIDPNHPDLRKSAEAELQGSTRLERGHQFFKLAEQRAAALKADFHWKMQHVPNGDHSDGSMAPAAAAALMAR